MNQNVVVTSTCSSEEEALRIAREVVERGLAACVQIIPGIRSVYRWQGKLEVTSEWLLLVKTNSAKFELLGRVIELLHSYDVPEVLAVPVLAGSEKYLAWMDEALSA
jgi:periplasmic divalent cation tolerance protein